MPQLALGQRFDNIPAFQGAVRKAAAEEGWNALVGRTETARHFTTMKCGQKNCTFHVRADTSEDIVKITRLNSEHNCLGLATENQRSSNGNHAHLIAATKEAMVVNPKTSGRDIARQLQHNHGHTGGSLSAIYKAKRAILNDAYGGEIESFKRLPAYVERLKAVDESTHAVLEEDVHGKFNRIFVCPAMDGTGALIVVAWTLTPGETEENWRWFLTHLRTSLLGLNDFTSTVVSDRNAGLLSAIDTVLPAANSLFCCFHIAKNVRDRGSSAAAVQLFWSMVYARTETQFTSFMDRLKAVDADAAVYIGAIDKKKWATCAVPGRRFGHVTSNLAEIANAMLLEARELPPLLCLDHIYKHQMERFFGRLDEAINCPSPIVAAEYAHLQAVSLLARRMNAVCSDTKSGVVTDTATPVTNGAQFVVKLPATVHDVGHCDCKQYQLMLRPCRHAVALLHKLKLSVVPYFHAYYTTEVWKKIYK
ncbi:hypothetical protein CF326_g9231, partial [Tilletia indica]